MRCAGFVKICQPQGAPHEHAQECQIDPSGSRTNHPPDLAGETPRSISSAVGVSPATVYKWLRRYKAEGMAGLERHINDHIDRHPDLKRDAELLHSIPGIGKTTVAKVLAYAGDVRRFTNAKALAAFIGVTPRQRVSGSSVKGRTMMSRTGHADLRRALYMLDLAARRHNPVLKVFGDRLHAAGLAPKAVVGAVMRKLAHLIYGVIKSGHPFDVNLSNMRLDLQDGI